MASLSCLPHKVIHMQSLKSRCESQVTGGLPEDTPELPEIPTVQGHHLYGGPQMLQLRYKSGHMFPRGCNCLGTNKGPGLTGAV